MDRTTHTRWVSFFLSLPFLCFTMETSIPSWTTPKGPPVSSQCVCVVMWWLWVLSLTWARGLHPETPKLKCIYLSEPRVGAQTWFRWRWIHGLLTCWEFVSSGRSDSQRCAAGNGGTFLGSQFNSTGWFPVMGGRDNRKWSWPNHFGEVSFHRPGEYDFITRLFLCWCLAQWTILVVYIEKLKERSACLCL